MQGNRNPCVSFYPFPWISILYVVFLAISSYFMQLQGHVYKSTLLFYCTLTLHVKKVQLQ